MTVNINDSLYCKLTIVTRGIEKVSTYVEKFNAPIAPCKIWKYNPEKR